MLSTVPTVFPRYVRAFAGRARFRRHWLVLAAALLWLLLCPGSQGMETLREDRKPAPSSSLSKAEAIALGNLWKQTDPQKRDFCLVSNSGSMAPVLDSRSVLLLEKATAADLRKNDISIYHRDTGPTVCHRVVEVGATSVLFDGDNNRASDGWIPADRIRWRVVSIIFTRRS